MRSMTAQERQEFLAGPHVAVLSIARAGGRAPHATPIWYAQEPGGDATFSTGTQERRFRKAGLIGRAGAVGLAVGQEEFPYRYVTLGKAAEGTVEGTVEGTGASEERPPAAQHALAVAGRYLRRYPPEQHAQGFVEAELGHPATEFVLFTGRPDRWLTFDFAAEAG